MQHILTFFAFLFLFAQGFSQNKNYARSIINDLASERFMGRAYEKNFDKKAANYIKNELKNNGISSHETGYMQFFPITTNTVSGKLSFAVNKKELRPGTDYLVSLNSPSANTSVQAVLVGKRILSNLDTLKDVLYKSRGQILVFDSVPQKQGEKVLINSILRGPTVIEAIVFLVDKLPPAVPYTEVAAIPSFYVLRQFFNAQEFQLDIFIESRLQNTRTQNVIGYLPGKSDSLIVFTAHYDHVGMMGNKTFFPGAHDNASGTAMVLDLARFYASKKEKPEYSMLFIFFAGEELGLLGSLYYVQNPVYPLENIKFLVNLDMISGGEKGIKVVNGSVFQSEFDTLSKLNKENNLLADVSIRGAAANSDHYYFYEKGVKCFFIYSLGAYSEYHTVNDKAVGLPLYEYEDIFNLLTLFVQTI